MRRPFWVCTEDGFRVRGSSVKSPLLAIGILAVVPPGFLSASDYPVRPVPFTDVRLTGGFWGAHQEVNRRVTLPYAFRQCEQGGRIRNFDLAAETLRRRAAGERGFQNVPASIFPFDDTDAYKVIEAASYALSLHPDPELAARVDGWIARIAAAQEPDGYLYTFRTMHPDSPVHPWIGRERWVEDPRLSHELYCAGHLYEAGAAHFQATGRRTLLEVCLRNADLLWRVFGDGRLRLAPGHEIVEMGLVKLYRVTGDLRYLKLARLFLDARGPGGPVYNQSQLRVIDQTEAVGHAVRANYLYCGMADVAALTGDLRYAAAVRRIWDDVAGRKLYLTGGVGARRDGEAYGADYELPADAYNETCAAVALMMWNERMFLWTGEARYMDVFERTAYNGFASGVSLSGDRFFYPNPLVYDGCSKSNNGCAGRAPWFGCACCPPNLMRMMASLGGYFYAVRGADLYVNLYGASEARVEMAGSEVGLKQSTAYPWEGDVRIEVSPNRPCDFTIRVRVPGWAQGRPVPSDLYAYERPETGHWEADVDGAPANGPLDSGYLCLRRTWRAGDRIELRFAMPVQGVRGNPRIADTRGRLALERGPVVYCVEDPGGRLGLASLALPDGRVRAEPRWRPGLLGGVTTIELRGAESAGRPEPPVEAVPYFAWDNRGLAPMEVWMRD